MFKVIELFAGIGSQTESLKEIGIKHEVVAISENDKYASKAYELLHGPVNNLGDIKQIKTLPSADIWTYSFPCNDISLAGTQKGFDKGSNTQSSLIWEVERLLERAKENDTLPPILLLENVKALISKRFINKFNVWLKYLESLGYTNKYKVLNAKDFNTPQNRERVFLFSFRRDASYEFPKGQELQVKLGDLLESDVAEKYFISIERISNFSDMKNRNGFVRGLTFRPLETTSPVAYTVTTRSGARSTDNFIVVPEDTKKGFKEAEVGDGIYINRPHQKRGVVQKNKIPTLKTTPSDLGVVVNKDDLISIRKITPREAWRLMGWKDERIDEVINHFSDSQLYKMAGNGIVINVLNAMFKNLKKVIE